MVKNCLLDNFDIDTLLNQKEVTDAKQNIDKLSNGSIYFKIDLTESIRKSLFDNLGIELNNINSIPMRWIKGDTHPHFDRSTDSFSEKSIVILSILAVSLLIFFMFSEHHLAKTALTQFFYYLIVVQYCTKVEFLTFYS
jgi:hypothetical protein